MENIQKKILKNELKLQLSKAKITEDNLGQVKKEERVKFIEIKKLEIEHACLIWALQKNLISEDNFASHKFSSDDEELLEYANGGLATAGTAGAIGAFYTTLGTAVSGGFCGIGATTTIAITSVTIAATAAPIVLAGCGIFGVIKYREYQEKIKLIEHFENEKEDILNYYLNIIDEVDSPADKNAIT